MTQVNASESTTAPLLGDYLPPIHRFEGLESFDKYLQSEEFLSLSFRKRFKHLAEKLIQKILEMPDEVFLLPAVLEYIDLINKSCVLIEVISFPYFEFWLNHFSGLDEAHNQKIRNKIMGKSLPRDAYQALFPIGMGKIYKGSHYVVAHLSPDVDTMIASFWGWVDAFAARVSTGLHVWCLPGGPPESPVTTLLTQIFGANAIDIIARKATTLTLSSIDLLTHKNLNKKHGGINISNLDHGASERAVILIDEEGHYLGDWRSTDVEFVRQIIVLFKACLRWFENNLHYQLITLFGKRALKRDDISTFLASVFSKKISASEISAEFSENQIVFLDSFLKTILNLKNGAEATFSDLNDALVKQGVHALDRFEIQIGELKNSDLFDKQGNLNEDRSNIFRHLESIHKQLNEAIYEVRNWAEQLDISMDIKEKVLKIPSTTLAMGTEVDVIRGKMGDYDYLCVTTQDSDGKQYPLGVVWDKDVRMKELGTVSFRDFSNFEEVKMASYLTVISVIDHHKTNISTLTPPLVILGDAQACNVLVAEQALLINDRYSLLGLTPELFKAMLPAIEKENHSLRLQERLFDRRIAAEHHKAHWISRTREYLEYLFFIHAIMDDTDLLTKVSARDVICVVELINRLKSLQLQRDVEVVSLDDIPQDERFAKAAAKKILTHKEMYSIYKKSFEFRQKEIETNLKLCVQHNSSGFFADTKSQNGCCRIGQAKMFPNNIPYFKENESAIRSVWVEKAREAAQNRNELDFHLFMISTIASAKDLFEGKKAQYAHQDELWFWIPDTESGQNHLASFLSAFSQSSEMTHNTLSLETWDPSVTELFNRHFLPIDNRVEHARDETQPKAILRFEAGTLNSRKAMISPYLPRLLS